MCKACSSVFFQVEEVDADDGADPYYCIKYVKEHLRDLEVVQAFRLQYLSGQEIAGTMHTMLVDWLVQMQMKFRLFQETLERCC